MYCPPINVKPSYYPALTKENKSSPSSPLPPVPSPANWLPCWGWILSKRVCVTTCKSLSKICDLDMEMKVCGVLSAARLVFLICLIWLASRTKSVKSLPITSVFVACRESCPCFSYACETCSCFKVILWELFMCLLEEALSQQQYSVKYQWNSLAAETDPWKQSCQFSTAWLKRWRPLFDSPLVYRSSDLHLCKYSFCCLCYTNIERDLLCMVFQRRCVLQSMSNRVILLELWL